MTFRLVWRGYERHGVRLIDFVSKFQRGNDAFLRAGLSKNSFPRPPTCVFLFIKNRSDARNILLNTCTYTLDSVLFLETKIENSHFNIFDR